jgi:pimeloyl-ACP methyl ester carboxylesterase
MGETRPDSESARPQRQDLHGEYDATEWQTKWRRLPQHHPVRVLIPVAKRDGMQDQLPQIHCPALILHGSADAVYPVDRAYELAENLPDAVNPHLRAFLDRTLRPA